MGLVVSITVLFVRFDAIDFITVFAAVPFTANTMMSPNFATSSKLPSCARVFLVFQSASVMTS